MPTISTGNVWLDLILNIGYIVVVPLAGYWIKNVIANNDEKKAVVASYERAAGAMFSAIMAKGGSIFDPVTVLEAARTAGLGYMKETMAEQLQNQNLSDTDVIKRVKAQFDALALKKDVTAK